MAEITLQAETGRQPGTSATKRLRRQGKIPGVVYGHGIDPVAIAVDGRELRSALTGDSGINALLTLQLEGESHLAMAKVLQRDPVRGTVTHIDFLVVRRDEVVTADVPVHIVGEAKAVHAEGGIIDQQLTTLTVKATPGTIPAGIDVDISDMAVGDTIRVADLTLPSGVETEVDGEDPVVIAQTQQVSDLDLISEADAEALQELSDAQAAAGEAGEAASGAPEGGSGDTEGQ